MVLPVLKFKRFAASCCKLEVVNGACGFVRRSLFSTFLTSKELDSSIRSSTSLTALLFGKSFFLLSKRKNFASNLRVDFLNFALIDQYSSGLNFFISSSRSQIIFKATDCTRPALKPRFTFFHNNGLILYPTIRSSTRLACCESIKSGFSFRGDLK